LVGEMIVQKTSKVSRELPERDGNLTLFIPWTREKFCGNKASILQPFAPL